MELEKVEEEEEYHPDDVCEHSRITVKTKIAYGLRGNVISCIHFNRAEEVIYPCENVIIFQDYVANKQRYLFLPEDSLPLIMAVSRNRKMLAVVESTGRTTMMLALYCTSTLKRKRYQEIPPNAAEKGIAHIDFDPEARTLGLLTKPPDELIFILVLDKVNTTLEARPGAWMRGLTSRFVFHPDEHMRFLLAGEKVLMYMNRTEKGIFMTNNIKIDFNITSLAYLNGECLLIGTDKNELLFYERLELKQKQKASHATILDLTWNQEMLRKHLETEEHEAPTTGALANERVLFLTAFKKGFSFAIFNKVFVFEHVSKTKFERKTIITIPFGLYTNDLYQITNCAVNFKGDTVIVRAKHNQIYVGILIVPETLKTRQLNFEFLGVSLHIDEIISISVCAWKKTVLTASRDRTIRIWNYETGKIELVRKFQYEIMSVELDPTGLMVALAFREQLRLNYVLLDDLKIIKHYPFTGTHAMRFSNFGHLLAVSYTENIALISVLNLEVLRIFETEEKQLSVCWNSLDSYLFSGNAYGSITQWEIETLTKTNEIYIVESPIVSLCVTSKEPFVVYAACKQGFIYEFNLESGRIRDITFPSRNKGAATCLCLSRADVVLFASNEYGELVFAEEPAEGRDFYFQEIRFFNSEIHACVLSADSKLLFCASANGTLVIFQLENTLGRIPIIDPDLLKSQEILIQRQHLVEKNKQIAQLENKLKKQQADFEYEMNQTSINETQQLEQVHRTYCAALSELGAKNDEIEAAHAEEMEQIHHMIDGIREENRRQLETLSNQYSERMLNENQKFAQLRDKMLEMRESYEEKLKKSTGTLHDTVEGLEKDFRVQMDERRELLRELMKEMNDKKVEFMEYCREVEIENDRNKVNLQIEFENQLNAERTITKSWISKTTDLEKKYDELNQELLRLIQEVETLKEEYLESKNNINSFGNQLELLKKLLTDRDEAINNKERRIHELIHKNTELEKYKLVLAHKIAELKEQITPKEAQIVDKRKHILELEHELMGLKQNNTQLQLQLHELRDKYISNFNELKIERQHARAARECIQNICTDIYYVAGKMDNIEDLKSAVSNLFYKHATDDELKRFISDNPEVRDEFMRQRAQLERVLAIYKRQKNDKTTARKYDKLLKENATLLSELARVQEINDKLKQQARH